MISPSSATTIYTKLVFMRNDLMGMVIARSM